MAERTLTVRILGDSRDLRREFDRSAKSAKGFQAQIVGVQRGLTGLGRTTAVAAALAVGFDQARRAAQAASNLNEQINKSSVVFGQAADSIKRWSTTTADAFGVSQRAALEAASSFGQILETSGINERRAAQMSRSLVELAADLASFNNIDPSEALDKLRSGLAGEAEPLRRVGVLLSEARVKQEAYATGIARAGTKLTEGQKVQARYRLILKDTATAQGDFERTSGSLANKQRVLSARVEELQSRLGEDLVPVLSTTIDFLLDAEDAAHKFAAALDELPGGTSFKLLDLFPKSKVSTDFVENLKRQSDQLDAAVRGGAADQRLFADELDKAARQRRIPPTQLNRIFDQNIARQLDRVADETLPRQVEALNRIERQITTEIGRVKDVTRKLTLRDQLLQVQRERAGVREQIAAQFLDNLQLGIDKAQLTATFSDDLRALDALERGIRQQIAASGRTNDLERQLLAIEQQRAGIAEQQREAARRAREAAQRAAEQRREAAQRALEARREARNARQFRALGLTREGQEPVPGVRALRRQLGRLDQVITGTFLDTGKTESIMKRIRRVLSGGLGAVGRDVREQISRILSDLDRQLKDHAAGAETRTRSLNSDAILANLGLSPDEIRALRGRLSRFNTAGVALAGGGAIGAFGMRVPPINIHTTVELDKKKVGQSTVSYQQQRARRNPRQKRGPFASSF